MSDLVQIDGSYGEGGGQILRTCATLSAITGRPLEIVNIRAGRAKPGLQRQHLMAVRAAGKLCGAKLVGDAVGSVFLRMEPTGPVTSESYAFDIGTAGSTSLVLQTVIPALAAVGTAADAKVVGGTHNPFAPTADYLERVYLPTLADYGWHTEYFSEKAGYNPIGGGDQTIAVLESSAPRPFLISERHGEMRISAYITVSNLPSEVAERGGAQVASRLKNIGPVEVHEMKKSAEGKGAAVLIVAEGDGYRAGFTGLGSKGKPMQKVADDACDDFLSWYETGAPLEEHLSDQLVLPAALTRGRSVWRTSRVTEHLRTVLWVVEQFLPVQTTLNEETGTVRVVAD